MSFDFDAEALGAGLTDEDEDEELVPAAGTDDADDPEYEVSVPGEDTDTLVPKPAAAPEPAEAPTGQGSSTEDPDPDAEAQQDPKPVATAVHAADTPAATSPAPTAPPQDAPEDYAMAAPANPEAAREDSATPAPPAQPAPEPVPEASPAAQQDAVDDIEVEDPPEPQRRTTFSDLPDYGGHQVYLSGWDGMPDDRGELRREGPVIATLHRTTGGQWYARMQLDPPDVTRLVEHPRTAAEQGAVMYAAFTGAPLGAPVVAAPGSDIQARAEQVRSELRHFAAVHAPSIETAVRQLSPRQRENPHYAELAARLADVADADGRGALMMAADLAGVERAVSEWGRALPPSPNSEIRVALAFPLAHMLFDVRQLQARLQATVEVADEERARLREAAAAAEPAPPAPAAAMEDIPAAEVPAGLEPRAVVDTATEPPALESGEPSRGATSEALAAESGEEPAAPSGGGGGPDTARAEEVGVALTVEEEDLEESVQAAPTNEPTAAPGTPGTDASFTPRDGLAEAAVAGSGEPDREGEDVPAGAEVRQADHMGAGAAVPTGDLPLWKTDELPLWKGRPTDDAAEAPVVLSAESQQDDPDLRMVAQPGREGGCGPVGQDVDRAVGCHVDEDRRVGPSPSNGELVDAEMRHWSR